VSGALDPPEATEAAAALRKVALHLSPNAHQCGMVAYNKEYTSHGLLGLQLLVIPKLWTGIPTPQANYDADRKFLRILGHEGQRIQLEGVPPAWERLLTDAIESALEVTGQEGEEDAARRADTGEEESPDDPWLAAYQRCLLTRMASGTPDSPPLRPWDETPGGVEIASNEDEDHLLACPLQQLVRLVVLSGALEQKALDYSPKETGAGYLVDWGEQVSDALRFLNAHAFVQEVKARAGQVRQGYRLRTEWLSGIRGRITARGLARYAATGEASLECTYDDFTSGIPLFQVIVTALDHVARGGPFPPVLRDAASAICEDAARLRRELAHIPRLPLALAAHQAGRIRLSRLWRPWAPALHMAKLLLRDDPLDFTGQEAGQGALVWSVNTAVVWEKVLEQMLDQHTARIEAQSEVVPPWKGLARKRPDLVFVHDHRRWVLDAKYKLREKAEAPSMDEQYQLFAYSHLPPAEGKDKDWPKKGLFAGLLYASEQSVAPVQPSPRTWDRAPLWVPKGPFEPRLQVKLGTFTVHFPQPAQLSEDAVWRAWIERVGKTLLAKLEAAAE
jgi:hypothetical protein